MRPFKDIDSVHHSLILKAFCVTFPLVSFPGWFFLGPIGIIYSGITCALVAYVSVFIAGRTGGTASKLWGGKTPIWNLSERYAADFSRARYQKMNKQYDEALRIIDHVLEEQPDYNEALFLKAQILSEGYNDTAQAKKYLFRILKTETKDSQVYKWTESLYRELTNRKSLVTSLSCSNIDNQES